MLQLITSEAHSRTGLVLLPFQSVWLPMAGEPSLMQLFAETSHGIPNMASDVKEMLPGTLDKDSLKAAQDPRGGALQFLPSLSS